MNFFTWFPTFQLLFHRQLTRCLRYSHNHNRGDNLMKFCTLLCVSSFLLLVELHVNKHEQVHSFSTGQQLCIGDSGQWNPCDWILISLAWWVVNWKVICMGNKGETGLFPPPSVVSGLIKNLARHSLWWKQPNQGIEWRTNTKNRILLGNGGGGEGGRVSASLERVHHPELWNLSQPTKRSSSSTVETSRMSLSKF